MTETEPLTGNAPVGVDVVVEMVGGFFAVARRTRNSGSLEWWLPWPSSGEAGVPTDRFGRHFSSKELVAWAPIPDEMWQEVNPLPDLPGDLVQK